MTWRKLILYYYTNMYCILDERHNWGSWKALQREVGPSDFTDTFVFFLSRGLNLLGVEMKTSKLI